MKPGRNDPCPCGSGKKYKHCCLAAEQAAAHGPEELLWRRVRREIDGFATRMFGFVLETYGSSAVEEAWGEFIGWDDRYGDFHPESEQLAVFMPWMCHCWSPRERDTDVADPSLHGVPPTRAFLARKGRHLSALHREYLEACLDASFGFFEVLHSTPGHGLRLCDVFSNETFDVREGSASRMLREGDLLYAQPVRLQRLGMLEACGPVAIPPSGKIELIELRKELQEEFGASPASEDREAWDDALRAHYLAVSDRILDPMPLQLCNTDGHALALQRLVFDVDSPQLAFDRLAHLHLLAPAAELLPSATRDGEGRLQRIAFDWHRAGNAMHASWDNTIFGHLEIDGTRLSLRVNSDERAAQGRAAIEDALGAHVRYRLTERESLQRPFQDVDAVFSAGPNPADTAELMKIPEVRAQVTAFIARHYESWPEQPLPALGGRTPRQAVGDDDGREQVEALLRQMERDGETQPGAATPEVIRTLRTRLGLT